MRGVGRCIQVEPGGAFGVVHVAEGPFALHDLFFDIKFAPGRLEELFTDDRKPLFHHVGRHGGDVLGLVLGGEGVDADRAVLAELGREDLGDVEFLRFQPQLLHLREFVLNHLRVGAAFGLLGLDHAVGRIDAGLKLGVLLVVGRPEVLGALEHHVLEHVGNPGFPSFLEGGPGPDRQSDRHLGCRRPLHDQEQHPVFQSELLDVQLQVGACFRRA